MSDDLSVLASTADAVDRATRNAIQAAVVATYEGREGESIDNRALVDEVSRRTGIPKDAFERRAPVGRKGTPHSLLQRTVRWHQQSLRRMGVIKRESRGVWRAVGKPGEELSQIMPGHSLLVFSTDLGIAVWADCRTLFASLGEEIALTITSPPYPLRKPRAYGNPPEAEYIDFICACLEPIVRWLAPGGSVVLNLSNDIFNAGLPSRSLYRERLVIALHERLGLQKMDELIWANDSKPPSPVQWASKTRQQLNSGWDPVYVITNDPRRFQGDNRRVLEPHSDRQKRLIERGGESRERVFSDGAHVVKPGSYGKPTAGRIPRNVIRMGHSCVDQRRYKAGARAMGLPAHGAPFPVALADFLIRYLSAPGQLVVDPCGGSLTTAVAAETLDRRWIASDISWEYLRGGAERVRGKPGFELNEHLDSELLQRKIF